MSKSLNIIDDQLNLGDVKTITSNGGQVVKLIELLFSSTTKAQFSPSEDKNMIIFSISDNHLGLPELNSMIKKETLRDLIISLKNIYNQLLDNESEEQK